MNPIQKEELDRLGSEWGSLGPDAAPERRLQLAEQIFMLAYKAFPEHEETIGAFFAKDWPRFDAQKGSLSSFFSAQLRFRRTKEAAKESGMKRRGQKDPVTGKRKEHYEPLLYLDQPVGGEAQRTVADLCDSECANRAPGSWDMLDDTLYDETAVAYLTLALQLPQRLRGRANNPQRLNYFRMFFTDDVVRVLHENLDSRPFAAHERELFRSMQLGFLDFFMAAVCRDVPALERCRVKPYGLLVPERPMKAPGHPLPNDVYMRYLEDGEGLSLRSAGTLSNQRKEYTRFMRENLG